MKHLQPTRVFFSKISENHEIEDTVFDEMFAQFRQIANSYGFSMSAYETISLGLAKYSIQNCDQCSCLMVNRDLNPAGLPGEYVFEGMDLFIRDGGNDADKSLCEECLPTTHRWGHHS